MAMQCFQLWHGPGLRFIIEEMKFFRLRQVNRRVLAQIGSQGRRATFLGTAHQKSGDVAYCSWLRFCLSEDFFDDETQALTRARA